MAYGDLLVRCVVPAQPTGSQWTPSQFDQAVKDAMQTRFQAIGLNSTRFSWLNRSDIPTADSAVSGFVASACASTAISDSKYQFSQVDPNASSGFCLVGGQLVLYQGITAEPIDPNEPDLLKIVVPLDGSFEVTVQLSFIVRTLQPFPAAEPTP